MPPVSFSKMKKIMPSWLSFSWGYWQSKNEFMFSVQCSKERCWWNAKFALASLKKCHHPCSAPHLSPWKGLCSFEQGRWQVSLSPWPLQDCFRKCLVEDFVVQGGTSGWGWTLGPHIVIGWWGFRCGEVVNNWGDCGPFDSRSYSLSRSWWQWFVQKGSN